MVEIFEIVGVVGSGVSCNENRVFVRDCQRVSPYLATTYFKDQIRWTPHARPGYGNRPRDSVDSEACPYNEE